MKTTIYTTCIILLCCLSISSNKTYAQNTSNKKPEQTIFVWGNDINDKFVRYILNLTDKPNPKICYLPTASADNQDNIKYWESISERLSIEPCILKVWVSSDVDTIPFEDTLLSMDAIVAGGGNTLNMLGIWNAQGIDQILKKALDKGIILAGGSAGSICWFQNGISDSRPASLSIVDGLSIIPYSNCPHYSDSLRKNMFHQNILNNKMNAGYACDDLSGILFKNGKAIESVSINEFNNSYFVSKNKRGNIQVDKLPTKFLVNKDALDTNEYIVREINKNLKTSLSIYPNDAIIKEFGSFIKRITKEEQLNNVIERTAILKVLTYKDSLTAVINDRGYDFYCVSLFYRKDGVWTSIGEDIGSTPLTAEITFREKAKIHLNRVKNEK